ncbi:hypothetical protein KY343_07050, partial [Candidatus Woesearchaeota archaeon]|nr:hypothetical protein [Candidatus Woesearchaeota archaeon]
YHKLSFAKLDKTFEINNKPKMAVGTCIGKDIQVMELNHFKPLYITMDRGFLTSAVYNIINDRWTEAFAQQYVDYISNKFFYHSSDVRIIFIYGECPFDRGPKDKWDHLEYNAQVSMYHNFLSRIPSKFVYSFHNNFDDESVETFERIYREAGGTNFEH